MHKQIENDDIRNETNRTGTVYHVRIEYNYGLWIRESESESCCCDWVN